MIEASGADLAILAGVAGTIYGFGVIIWALLPDEMKEAVRRAFG